MPTHIAYVPVNATTETLYETGNNEWAIVTVKKESSGDVILGTKKPLNGTTGMSSLADVPILFLLAPNTSLYAYASDIQAVGIIIQPVPFLAALTALAPKQELIPSPITGNLGPREQDESRRFGFSDLERATFRKLSR